MDTFFIRFKQLMFVSLFFISAPVVTFFPSSVAAQANAKLIEFWDDSEADSIMTVAHGPWQEILDAYVDDQHPSGINRFDYEAVSDTDVVKLKQYIAYLQLLEPRQLNSSEAKAYWINFYNALTVEIITDTVRDREVRSVRRLANRFLNRKTVNVVTKDLSMNDIHHGILRPIWNDARVHYALSVGALGGGNLQKLAYTGENVEQQLAKAEKEYLNHDRGIRFEDGRVIASSVFDWYHRDFVASKSQLISYIAPKVEEGNRAQLIRLRRVRFDFDWTINGPYEQY